MRKTLSIFMSIVLILLFQSLAYGSFDLKDQVENLESEEYYQVLAEDAYSKGSYDTALAFYYMAFEKEEISREKAIEKMNKVRKEDITFSYFASMKNAESPNIFLREVYEDETIADDYSIFQIAIINRTNEIMEINRYLTNFTAITESGNQVNSYTPNDSSELINALRNNMIYDEHIYPNANIMGFLIFPYRDDYEGIYINPIIHSGNDEELIYIDFLKN